MRNPFAAAANRLQKRTSTSPYAGASTNRLTFDFILGTLSADQVNRWSIQTLRNRARELVYNNTTGSRVPQLFSENVIGKDGVTYQAAVTLGDGAYDTAVNKELETGWYRWGERYASVDGKLAWPELEALFAESEPVDGEVLIRLVEGFDNPFRFAIDVLDPDQLDHTYERLPSEGQNEIRMGVEMNTWGRPVAYHIWANHPSEIRRGQRLRVPAEQILHTFLRRRARQTRGVTWYAPAIVDLRMHGGYREAELFAARASANKMGFFELDPDADPMTNEGDDTDLSYVPMEAEPGLLEQLPPGFKFKSWDPVHPTTAYADFDASILRSLAVGFRVAYMSLSGDLNGTSYGSGRIGLLAEQAVYRALQQRHILRHCSPVHRAFLRMGLLSGALRLPSFDVARYELAAWHPRPFPWIDPEKDLNYRLGEVRAGVNSLTRIAAEQGRDLEEVLQEREREIALAEKYGVPLDLMWSGTQAPAANGAPATTSAASPDGADGSAQGRLTGSRRAAAARQAPPMRLLRGT